MATISRDFAGATLGLDGSLRVDGTSLTAATPQALAEVVSVDPADKIYVVVIRSLPDGEEQQCLQEVTTPAGGSWQADFATTDPPFAKGQTVRLIGLAISDEAPYFWEETALLEPK